MWAQLHPRAALSHPDSTSCLQEAAARRLQHPAQAKPSPQAGRVPQQPKRCAAGDAASWRGFGEPHREAKVIACEKCELNCKASAALCAKDRSPAGRAHRHQTVSATPAAQHDLSTARHRICRPPRAFSWRWNQLKQTRSPSGVSNCPAATRLVLVLARRWRRGSPL